MDSRYDRSGTTVRSGALLGLSYDPGGNLQKMDELWKRLDIDCNGGNDLLSVL